MAPEHRVHEEPAIYTPTHKMPRLTIAPVAALWLGFAVLLATPGCQKLEENDVGSELPVADFDSDFGMCTEALNTQVYHRWIEPLVTGGQPSTCNQCHLAGVTLTNFVQKDPCHSMACLQHLGLVDFDNPEKSRILEQILLAEPDSKLITRSIIDGEYVGFLEWITWSSTCHADVCGELPNPCASPATSVPRDVISPLGGACSEDALIDSFNEKVFVYRDRCEFCHSFDPGTYDFILETYDPLPPYWVDSAYDPADPQSVRAAAGRSMYNAIGLNAFDPVDPRKSQFLLKPLYREEGGVEHGGGDKMSQTDDMFIDTMEWNREYVECYGSTNSDRSAP